MVLAEKLFMVKFDNNSINSGINLVGEKYKRGTLKVKKWSVDGYVVS